MQNQLRSNFEKLFTVKKAVSATAMKLLKELNEKVKILNKPIIKAEMLAINKKYKILSFKAVSGTYGEQVLLELEEGKLYLPQRYTSLFSEKAIDELNVKGRSAVVLKGFLEVGKGKNKTPEFVFEDEERNK